MPSGPGLHFRWHYEGSPTSSLGAENVRIVNRACPPSLVQNRLAERHLAIQDFAESYRVRATAGPAAAARSLSRMLTSPAFSPVRYSWLTTTLLMTYLAAPDANLRGAISRTASGRKPDSRRHSERKSYGLSPVVVDLFLRRFWPLASTAGSSLERAQLARGWSADRSVFRAVLTLMFGPDRGSDR